MRCCGMATYRITITNSEFDTTIEQDLADLSAAKAEALKGVLDVASEQVVEGTAFFAAEVTVSGGNERSRFIVALGVSELQ
jgi:hypothetical protein